MAVVTQQVVVRVTVNGAAQVNTQLQQVGQAGQSAFGGMNSAIATAGKALISMAAILVAYNLLIKIPQEIANGFYEVAKAAIAAADEAERAVYSTAGLLASFASFGPTLGESFENAVIMSEQLEIKFAALAAKSVVSASTIRLAFQTLVGHGGLELTKDFDDAATAAAKMTNIIVALTGGMQTERRVVSEIGNTLEGNASTYNVIGRLIKAQVGDLKAWLESVKQNHNLTAELARLFPGMDAAAQRLGNTMQGMVESIKGSLEQLDRITMHAGGGFAVIVNYLREWRDLIGDAVQDIGTFNGHIDQLRPGTQEILLVFIRLGESIGQILQGTEQLIANLFGTHDKLMQIDAISYDILQIAVFIRTVLESLNSNVLVKSLAVFTGIWVVVKSIMMLLAGEELVVGFAAIGAAIAPWLPILAGVAAVLGLIAYNIVPAFKENMADATADMEKMQANLAKHLADISKAVTGDLFKTNGNQMTDKMAKTFDELKDRVEATSHGANEFYQIIIKLREEFDKLRHDKDFEHNNAALQQAAGYLDEIGQNEVRNLLYTKLRTAELALQQTTLGEVAKIEQEEIDRQTFLNEALAGNPPFLEQMKKLSEQILAVQKEMIAFQVKEKFDEQTASFRREISAVKNGGDEMEEINQKAIRSTIQAVKEFRNYPELLTIVLGLIKELADTEREALDFKNFTRGMDAAAAATDMLLQNMREVQKLNQIGTAGALEQANEIGTLTAAQLNMRKVTNDIMIGTAEAMRQMTKNPEEIAQLTQKIDQLSKKNKELTLSLHEQADAWRQIYQRQVTFGDVLTDILIRVVKFHEKIKDVFKDELPNILRAAGQAVQAFFTSWVSGADSSVPLWKKALAAILNVLGEMAAAMASFALAGGVIPIFSALFGGPGAAIALFAAAGVMFGLAAKLGGGGGSSSGGSDIGSGSATVVISPQDGINTQLQHTLSQLNNNLKRISTMPAGVVVAAGAPAAGTAIVVAADRTVQGNAKLRSQFQTTMGVKQ
jgi:hypothetical protein